MSPRPLTVVSSRPEAQISLLKVILVSCLHPALEGAVFQLSGILVVLSMLQCKKTTQIPWDCQNDPESSKSPV